MQISALAQCTGVSAHALRHYERLGLITPSRLRSGYREYTEAQRRQVVDHIGWLREQEQKQRDRRAANPATQAPWPSAQPARRATAPQTPTRKTP